MVDLKLLDSPFSEEEICHALFSLARDKAPGHDGFPISFYQYFWETIKADILNLFMELSIGTVDISKLNYTHIALISKKANYPIVTDNRPISLEHGILKIISKVFLIRLSTIMESLVQSS